MSRLSNFLRRAALAATGKMGRPRASAILDPHNFQPELPIPAGYTKDGILDALCSVTIDRSAMGELRGYAIGDFERFLHTLHLVPEASGELLEIGGNPYFTTLLLRRFRPEYKLNITNFFGSPPGEFGQRVRFDGFDGIIDECEFRYQSLNIEFWPFPYADGQMDVVVFCEVLEHMTNDPMHALREISRVLKPGGLLILTTPNAARIENMVAFIEGRNMYDQYSGYGPYGRHNREYTRDELHRLLQYCGFDVEISFTANVHPDVPASVVGTDALEAVVRSVHNREYDLGQYLFTRWRKARDCAVGRPRWLYRSYPEQELTD